MLLGSDFCKGYSHWKPEIPVKYTVNLFREFLPVVSPKAEREISYVWL